MVLLMLMMPTTRDATHHKYEHHAKKYRVKRDSQGIASARALVDCTADPVNSATEGAGSVLVPIAVTVIVVGIVPVCMVRTHA